MENVNSKQKLYHSLMFNTFCRVKPSSIGGVGVFAILPIKKGMIVFKAQPSEKWYSYTKRQIDSLPKEVQSIIQDFFYMDETIQIPNYGIHGMDMSFYLNHSLKPNVKPTKNWNFITTRNIKKGEELTYKYDNEKYPKRPIRSKKHL